MLPMIYGYVRKSGDSTMLALGSVTSPHLAVTNLGGGYYSMAIGPGKYSFVASAEGFVSATKEITVASGQRKLLDFFLTPAPATPTPVNP